MIARAMTNWVMNSHIAPAVAVASTGLDMVPSFYDRRTSRTTVHSP